MPRALKTLFLTAALAITLPAQTPEQDHLIDQARTHYYSLVQQGLVSFSCAVHTDWDTLPPSILKPAEAAGRKPLEETKLIAFMGIRGPITVTPELPADTAPALQPTLDKFFEWHSSLIRGFLMVWQKSIDGMIPRKESVLSAQRDPQGYAIQIRTGGPTVTVHTNPDFLITTIHSSAGQDTSDEHPTFVPSPEGLLFTGSDTQSASGTDSTHVHFTLDYQPVQGLQLPHHVHLIVNDNIDEKFSFENCTVVRGATLNVAPPKP